VNDPHSTARNVFISTSKQFPQTSELLTSQVARFVMRTRFTALLPLDVFRLKFTQIQ